MFNFVIFLPKMVGITTFVTDYPRKKLLGNSSRLVVSGANIKLRT